MKGNDHGKKTIHTLEEIYPESAVAAQRERYEKSAEEFRSIFGDSEQLRYFSAPAVQKSEATTPTTITARCLRQV